MPIFPSKSPPQKPRTAAGERVYAIGDIHGRYDLLQQLMSLITSHWERTEKTAKRVRILFLGDLIDRGPDSASCLRLVTKLAQLPGVACLRGNHEDLLLRSVEGYPDAQRLWLENGGQSTLDSFDISPPASEEDCFDFAERVKAAIPEEQLAMLTATRTHARSGDYFFAHAGVRPGVSLSKQVDFDLFFIRDEFTSSTQWHGAVIVHGHSVVNEVSIMENRIAIDTAAYRSGKLSCVYLEGETQCVIST